MTSHNDHIMRQIKSFDPTNEADLYDLWRALDKRFRKRELKIAFYYNGEVHDDFYIHQIDITGMRTDVAIALIQKNDHIQNEVFISLIEDDVHRQILKQTLNDHDPRVLGVLEGDKADWHDTHITPEPIASFIDPRKFMTCVERKALPVKDMLIAADFLLSKWTTRKVRRVKHANGFKTDFAVVCGKEGWRLEDHDANTAKVLLWEKQQNELQAVS